MPMDYDDNDSSHHNLQLTGESRARSSSELRPYDFPKFDFDDSLQGHLRFDSLSLVETEVFLGIQSQEDNQWIEDFSRGSNGMEFNSTPADSCSISRRNNVWSEATSSESVEMLLKSVGQEEMMPGVSIAPESDVNADQGTFSKLVESSNNNKLKERNVAHAANAVTTSPSDEALRGHPPSSRHMEEQLEKPSAAHTKDKSPCGNSCNFSQNTLCTNGGALTNEGKHSHHSELTSETVKHFKTIVEKTLSERDSLGVTSISDNVDSDIGMLSTSKTCQKVNSSVSLESCISDGQEKHISSKTALEDAVTLQGTTGVTSIHTCSAGGSFGLVPDSGRDSQVANLDSGRESVDNLVKGEFVLKSSTRDDTSTSFTNSTETVRPESALAINNEMVKLFDNCKDGSSLDCIVQHSVDLGSISSGHCSSSEQMVDPTVQLPHQQDKDNNNMEDVSVSPLKCVSVSEMSLLSMEVNEAPTIMDEGIGKAVLSSVSDPEHSENSLGCSKNTIAVGVDSGAQLLADSVDVSVQVILNVDHRQGDNLESEKDMCKTRVAYEKMPSDIEDANSKNVGTLETDYKTQSLEVSEGLSGDTTIHRLQPQTSGKLESEKVSNFTTINASTASADHPDVGLREPASIGLLHCDNLQEEAGIGDASLQAEVDNALKVEVSVADDTVQNSISDISEMAQQHVEKIGDISSSLPSSMEPLKSLPLGNNSSLKENADLVSGGETMTKEEEKETGQTADIDKNSCGSPTIISSSEPSQLENNNQEEGRCYQVTNEVKDIQSTSGDLKRINSLGDDSGFTFKVHALPDTVDREPGKNWSPFSDVEKSKVLEETTPSNKGKTERTPSQKTPRKNAKVFDGETRPGTSKGSTERKGRQGSAKGSKKENVKKGKQSKIPTQENASLKVDKVSNSLLSPPGNSPHVQFGLMQQHYGNVEATNKKPSGAVAASNLPDLNNSTSSNSLSPQFRQPFSDLQQVQLRAQIFLYGSLIQGIVPDEACMVSAFGQYEGGRNFWERTWRAAAERLQNQKSTTAAETPRSESGARASDAVKQGSHSSKVPVTPVSRANSKETPAVLGPISPLSSPLWNISTPAQHCLISNPMHKGPAVDFQHALTPVHPYQTLPIRSFVGHPSWPLQTSFPGPWLASPQSSSFNSNAQLRPVTMTETVKLTPIKDTSTVLTSGGKHTTSGPSVHIVSPSPALGGVSPLHDPKSIASAAEISVDAKPRKRKKVPISDHGQVNFVSEVQTGAKVISNVASLSTIPVNVSIPAFLASDTILSKPSAGASTAFTIELPKNSDLDPVKSVTCSEEMLSKVAEAKSQAEDAAALANDAVMHCEDLWGQLAKQKDSGRTLESEDKLASSAAVIAAAASVAKAASAAAQIAYNAALQAKLMAVEVFHSSKNCGVAPSSGKSSNDMHNTGNATPSSILSSKSVTNQSSSILVAAKEAAKRRVEAASAASRQAEILDAIVKAAELAAAAVSQAGKIVAMGEPLPLSDLIEAGPEGYWKLPQPSIVSAEKLRDRNIDQSGAVSSDKTGVIPACTPADSAEKGLSDDVHLTEGPDGLLNACSSIGVKGSKDIDEKDFRIGTDHETSDTSKSSKAALEIDTLPKTTNVNDCADVVAQAVDGIEKGSHVEVFKPRSVQKSAWYTANVLGVEKGKAYVCYNDLLSEEDSGNVREWVPLESEGDKAPIIRIAHSLQRQKTRKRRRAALVDYVWCVGDRVDVWINDSWWEGVVTEKNEKDETTLKVHISALGETSAVRGWNLRASRSWINGKWIEWSSSKGQNISEQSDTPQEKRQKLGSPIVSKSKDKEPNDLDSTLGNPEPSKLLTLSTSERTFDIGKTTTSDNNKHAARRPLRTNQQKEGSRVVFGVPKPTGKKRKFIEVSKHFSANKTDKSNETNNSVKFAKYLIPQVVPSRGWKVSTRIDSKEKPIVESRPRVPSTRKPQRALPRKENSRSKMAQNVDIPIDQGSAAFENTSDKSMDQGSAALEEAAEAPLSSLLSHSLGTTSKKISSSNSISDRLHRGRPGHSGGKLNKIQDKVYSTNTGKSTIDVSEPRRSNRQIQPTHRLLEGLQSSMAIPKMPAVSHDKSRRNLPARGK